MECGRNWLPTPLTRFRKSRTFHYDNELGYLLWLLAVQMMAKVADRIQSWDPEMLSIPSRTRHTQYSRRIWLKTSQNISQYIGKTLSSFKINLFGFFVCLICWFRHSAFKFIILNVQPSYHHFQFQNTWILSLSGRSSRFLNISGALQ